MVYAQLFIIVFLVNQTATVVAAGSELTILRERVALTGEKDLGQRATKPARMSVAAPLDRVATAIDGAESSYGKDIRMWRPHPSGPQGPMQVSKAAASDVGGGDRFDLTQNRLIGRAYLALLYGRYKNWPDAIAAYNWGLSNVDSWIRAGRPSEELLAGVAAYTNRVLRDSGLCHGIETRQLRLSAIYGDDAEIRTVNDPSPHVRFAEFTSDGAQFTGNHRYLCPIEPSGRSKVSQKRLHGDRSVGLFERIAVSARSSWKAAIHGSRDGLTRSLGTLD
jgi:hypothetical protein